MTTTIKILGVFVTLLILSGSQPTMAQEDYTEQSEEVLVDESAEPMVDTEEFVESGDTESSDDF